MSLAILRSTDQISCGIAIFLDLLIGIIDFGEEEYRAEVLVLPHHIMLALITWLTVFARSLLQSHTLPLEVHIGSHPVSVHTQEEGVKLHLFE